MEGYWKREMRVFQLPLGWKLFLWDSFTGARVRLTRPKWVRDGNWLLHNPEFVVFTIW